MTKLCGYYIQFNQKCGKLYPLKDALLKPIISNILNQITTPINNFK